MTDNNCFDDLMNKLDGDDNFQLFSDMVSMVMAGHWQDRLDTDGVYAEDDEAFEEAVCRYLRNIRLRNHANRYLKPKPVF